MTDQMFLFLCRDVHKYAFEYRRGELPSDDVAKLEAHVARCEACQRYLDRLEGMLDAAAIHDFAAGMDRDAIFGRIADEVATDDGGLDRDVLFERITGELEAVPTARGDGAPHHDDGEERGAALRRRPDSEPLEETPVVRLPQFAAASDDEIDVETAPRSNTRFWIVAALAAGIAIGISIPYFTNVGDPPAPVVPEVANRDVSTPNPDAPAEFALADLALQPVPAEIEDVRVFGTPTANWNIRSQGAKRRMKLDDGTVLVEFLPERRHSLEVVTPQFTVDVTGTIFYASAADGVVGVVTGSVEVRTEDDTVELTDGEEWSVAEGKREARRASTDEARRFVDPMEHRRVLAERAERPPEERKREMTAPRPPISKEVARTPREALRAEADEALRDGRYEVAAQFYERMVAELSATDPANASLRLDLARIYIKHLDRPARAATHLRRFVRDRPEDPASPSARTELCRIVRSNGQTESLCE